MGLKETVTEMLVSGREKDLAELVIADRRALRPLVGRLWDPKPEIRRLAARAVGRAGSSHPDLGERIVRRLMWALNDESATNGVYGIPALGELGSRSPRLLAPFVPALVRLAEDGGLRPAILAALHRIALARPDLVSPHVDALDKLVDGRCAEEVDAFRMLVDAAERKDFDDRT